MKCRHLIAISALALGIAACKGTYQPPLIGGTVDWEFDPDTGDKKAAYDKLEDALAENLAALTQAAINGDEALRELAETNIDLISDAKERLAPDSMRQDVIEFNGQTQTS